MRVTSHENFSLKGERDEMTGDHCPAISDVHDSCSNQKCHHTKGILTLQEDQTDGACDHSFCWAQPGTASKPCKCNIERK